jgi:hypothetical protein
MFIRELRNICLHRGVREARGAEEPGARGGTSRARWGSRGGRWWRAYEIGHSGGIWHAERERVGSGYVCFCLSGRTLPTNISTRYVPRGASNRRM